MKTFNVMMNVGKAKYLVSFHNGINKHTDGSIFFDARIFKNKKDLKNFTDNLLKDNYKPTN